MGLVRKITACVLAAVLFSGIFAGSFNVAFAAVTPVNIYIDNYDSGTLDFHWDQLTGAKSVRVEYHALNPDGSVFNYGVNNDQTENSYTVTGLKKDYIYDIHILLYDDTGGSAGSGSVIGEGLLYYLPGITFNYSVIETDPEDISGGGVDSGKYPRLKLNWLIPYIWSSDTGNFEKANDPAVLAQMQQALRNVYKDDREITSLNFRINISSDVSKLNGGSSQAALIINQNATGYTANVSGVSGTTAETTGPDANGYVSFQLWGHIDSNAPFQTKAELDAGDTIPVDALTDNEILPGSVYYMNIKPVFENTEGNPVSTVTVGNHEDQNGSLLSGLVNYAFTPIRFQLTKDSLNNTYVKIYKINQGSLDMPRLFYELQATDDPSIQGDWTIRKTMDDSYFSGEYALTVVTGVNPNNTIYYKIVVKSDSPNDRLESLKMPYTLNVDTTRPPVPTGVTETNRVLNVKNMTIPEGGTISVKSSDITISWDKPLNWDDIKDNLYFYFLISTNQTSVTDDVPLYINGTYWDSYPVNYRLVKYVSAKSPNIKVVGDQITYTLNAFDLFKWEDDAGSTAGHDIPNADGYPSFFFPNTVYYLQMYTTTADDRGTSDPELMSDKSIITSFTTLSGEGLDVPQPKNLTLSANGKDTSAEQPVNYIDLQFDKVTNLDWNNYTDDYDSSKYNYNIYYDILMNMRTDTDFTVIGTTQDLNGDVVFTGVGDPMSTSVKVRISRFSDYNLKALFDDALLPDTTDNLSTMFGYNLYPNTTYYFKVRTRLVITEKADPSNFVEKQSADTALLPVTTTVINISPPENPAKPLAPTDFAIAVDSSGNQMLSGESVTFTWKWQEDDVKYELIRTSQKVSPNDQITAYQDDPEYVSFLEAYDKPSDGAADGKVYLDPTPGAGYQVDPGKFTYDSETQICTYTADRRMFPNKLYYFSLKALKVTGEDRHAAGEDSESVWVSIPVTTSLIDAPVMLEAVNDAELGFFWKDPTAGMTADDYSIYLRGPGDSDYKPVSISQSTIVKDADGETYYGRIPDLKANTLYDVKVYRVTGGGSDPVFEKTGMSTGDSCHEIEIKWTGAPVDDYSYYQIALMAEGSSEYTVLDTSDLKQYSSKDGKILPYYMEETAQSVNQNDTVCFHARIQTSAVSIAGGGTVHMPLQSDTRYYIKVRAVKVDPVDNLMISYSKYVGPIDTRTDFNQDDYDSKDREKNQEAVYMDRIKELEQGYYWEVSGDGSQDAILLKGDRVANAVGNMQEDTFTVDMTSLDPNAESDEIYVPLGVIKALNSCGKSLQIITPGTMLVLRPGTLDAQDNTALKEISGKPYVEDVYLKLVLSRSDNCQTPFPPGLSPASEISSLDLTASGYNQTDTGLENLVYDKLYNQDSGLVNENLQNLQDTYIGDGPDASKLQEEYTGNLIGLIETELASYIGSTLNSSKLVNTEESIDGFDTPASVSLDCSSSGGVMVPYALYDGSSAWQKISSGTAYTGNIAFNASGTGKYAVLAGQNRITDVPDGYQAKDYIVKLMSKYDLSDIFSDINGTFMPENKVTCREAVLLYEKATGRDSEDAGLDIKQKAVRLGLDGIFNMNGLMKNIKRQEMAALLFKLFAVKTGAGGSLKPGGTVYINDEADIDEAYYNQVMFVTYRNVMSTDSEGNFLPKSDITRAETAEAFVRLLELTGDI